MQITRLSYKQKDIIIDDIKFNPHITLLTGISGCGKSLIPKVIHEIKTGIVHDIFSNAEYDICITALNHIIVQQRMGNIKLFRDKELIHDVKNESAVIRSRAELSRDYYAKYMQCFDDYINSHLYIEPNFNYAGSSKLNITVSNNNEIFPVRQEFNEIVNAQYYPFAKYIRIALFHKDALSAITRKILAGLPLISQVKVELIGEMIRAYTYQIKIKDAISKKWLLLSDASEGIQRLAHYCCLFSLFPAESIFVLNSPTTGMDAEQIDAFAQWIQTLPRLIKGQIIIVSDDPILMHHVDKKCIKWISRTDAIRAEKVGSAFNYKTRVKNEYNYQINNIKSSV